MFWWPMMAAMAKPQEETEGSVPKPKTRQKKKAATVVSVAKPTIAKKSTKKSTKKGLAQESKSSPKTKSPKAQKIEKVTKKTKSSTSRGSMTKSSAVRKVSNKTEAAETVTKKAPKKAVTKTVSKKKTAGKTAKSAKVLKKPANTSIPTSSLDFSQGDKVVYPAHGVGQIDAIENMTVSGMDVTLYTISFVQNRMKLKLPVQKVKKLGLRKLSDDKQIKSAFQTMKGKAKVKRTMWSRRAQEYEAKINSGDPLAVAEVLRDLKRNATGVEHSYSERQIYQSALARLGSELAAIEKIAQKDAEGKIEKTLLASGA